MHKYMKNQMRMLLVEIFSDIQIPYETTERVVYFLAEKNIKSLWVLQRIHAVSSYLSETEAQTQKSTKNSKIISSKIIKRKS